MNGPKPVTKRDQFERGEKIESGDYVKALNDLLEETDRLCLVVS